MKHTLMMLVSLVALAACETVRIIGAPTLGGATPSVTSGVGFNVIAQSSLSNTVKIRASWSLPTDDGRGSIDYYLHTMTANKNVGTLPVREQVLGTADTVEITRPGVADTVIITSSVWSVRRTLESTTAATGRLVIMTADGPPPPPDTVFVDTLFLAPSIVQSGMSSIFSVSRDDAASRSYTALFARKEHTLSEVIQENTTFVTLFKN